MPNSITWLKRGRGIAFGRDGGSFHVIHDYTTDENGDYTGYPHLQTTNVREAVISYVQAIAYRMECEMLAQYEAEGYDPETGQKRKSTLPPLQR